MCAPCTEAVSQRLSTERVHRRPAFASIWKTDKVSDEKSCADTESFVVDESADSVVGDAVQSSTRLSTRSPLEADQTMLVE